MGKGGKRQKKNMRKGQQQRLRSVQRRAQRMGGQVVWRDGRPAINDAQIPAEPTQTSTEEQELDMVQLKEPVSLVSLLGNTPEVEDGDDISDD